MTALSTLLDSYRSAALTEREKDIYFEELICVYLSREEKLEKIVSYGSVAGITAWQSLVLDQHGDWLKQRDNSFGQFVVMGDKDDPTSQVIFKNYTRGLETGRDA